jgi:hypothetical protein
MAGLNEKRFGELRLPTRAKLGTGKSGCRWCDSCGFLCRAREDVRELGLGSAISKTQCYLTVRSNLISIHFSGFDNSLNPTFRYTPRAVLLTKNH